MEAVSSAERISGTNADLQAIVDAAASRGGGVAELPAGVYLMHDALHLRSGVHVAAKGRVVLRHVASVESAVLDQLGQGHYEFRVAEPEKFRVGMGVLLFDRNTTNFCTTAATIVERRGDTFFVSRPFARDYNADAQARVVSVHSLIEGVDIEDASASGLVLEGLKDRETCEISGCRGAGAFLLACRRVVLRGLEIGGFRGDGVSFQQCVDIRIEGCNIHDNAGSGLHPGSGTVRYAVRGNNVHANGRCGIFYCLRTKHSVCEGNRFEGNGACGISIGERDSDHLIRRNQVAGNDGPGVEFRPILHEGGDRVQLIGNTLRGNCLKRGYAEVIIVAGLRDIHLAGNTIDPQTPGVRPVAIKRGTERISAGGNTIAGRGQRLEDFIVPAADPRDTTNRWVHTNSSASVPTAALADWVRFETPANLPAVGPAALPLDGARHLGLAALDPWRE